MFNGKIHYNLPFSIAMLVITRGYPRKITKIHRLSTHHLSPQRPAVAGPAPRAVPAPAPSGEGVPGGAPRTGRWSRWSAGTARSSWEFWEKELLGFFWPWVVMSFLPPSRLVGFSWDLMLTHFRHVYRILDGIYWVISVGGYSTMSWTTHFPGNVSKTTYFLMVIFGGWSKWQPVLPTLGLFFWWLGWFIGISGIGNRITGIIPEKSHYQFSIIVILAISLIWINGLFLWHYFSGMIHRDFWEY